MAPSAFLISPARHWQRVSEAHTLSPPPGHDKLYQDLCCCQETMLITSCGCLITFQSFHTKLLFVTNPYPFFQDLVFRNYFNLSPSRGTLLHLYRFPAAWKNKESFSLSLLLPNLPFSLSLHPFNCQLGSLICLLLSPPSTVWCLISNSLELLCTYHCLS